MKTFILITVCALVLLLHTPAEARIFGAAERKHDDISQFPKWTHMLQRFAEEEAECDVESLGKLCNLQDWKNLLQKQKNNTDRLEVLHAVHSFINDIPYVQDIEGWDESDYWATPMQFFARGGDCEDFAIAKYMTLRKLGFDSDDMRVVVLFDHHKNLLHSVLVVTVGRYQYLLDNDIPIVLRTNEIRHYEPLYSINERSWWDHRAKFKL